MNRTGNITLDCRKQFIIWEGLHKADTQIIVANHVKDFEAGEVHKIYRWPGFDSRYMQRAKLSVSQPPLVENFSQSFQTTPPVYVGTTN